MQLLDGLLENLGRNLAQPWELLFCSWQVVKLLDRGWEISGQEEECMLLTRTLGLL
jgi:hypothetical protein